MQALVGIRKEVIKGVLLSLFIFPVIFLLNNDSMSGLYWKTIQAVIFTLASATIIIQSKLRLSFFYVALGLVILTAVLYIVREISLADMAGSTGIGLIIINLISYIPQFVKLGYIRKL